MSDGKSLTSMSHPIGDGSVPAVLDLDETAIEDVVRSLEARLDAREAYVKAVGVSVTNLANRLGTIEGLLEDFAERMAKLEYAIHSQAQGVAVQLEALERQTRYRAAKLANGMRDPGTPTGDTIDAAGAWLAWLRSNV